MSRGLNKVKGQEVYVEGRLQTRIWEDSVGSKHCSIEIVPNEMMILGERKDINQNLADMPLPEVTMDGYPFDGEK